MAKKTRESKPRAIAARLKGQQAIRLRVAGATISQIAEQLGYASDSSAYKAIIRELEMTARYQRESNEAVRELELKRLDQMQFPIWQGVINGDTQSVATALRIQERRASLLGLDAPKQIDARVRLDVMSWNEALKDFLEIYKEYHGQAPEAPQVLARLDLLGQEKFAGAMT